MLKVETLNNAYGDAEYIWQKGNILIPKPDSTMGPLVNQCLISADLAYSSHTSEGVDSGEAIVDTLNQDSLSTTPTLDDSTGEVIHDALVNEVTDQLVKETRTWLSVVRDIVIPAVNEGYSKYESAAAELKVSAVWDLEIEQHRIAPFYTSHAFVETVNRYKDSPFSEVGLYDLRLESTEEKVLEMLKTGDPTIDTELPKMIPAGELLQVFHHVFGRQRNFSNTSEMSRVPVQRRWFYPVVYQYANYLMNNIPEGIHLSLEQYRQYLTDLKIRMAKYCLAVLNQYQHEFDSRKMVIYQDRNKLVVDARVFPAFIEQGGSEETLQEAIRLGRWEWKWFFENLEAIKASRVKFMNSQAAFQEQKNSAAKLQLLKQHLTDAARQMVSEDQLGVLELLMGEMAQVTTQALDNPYHWFRERLVELIFPGTPVMDILKHYDNVAPSVESGDPREIGTLAVIRWLTYRVMGEFDVEHGRFEARLTL